MKGLGAIRTDVVGSLLRPDALARARLRHERGEIGEGEFRAAENKAVDRAIRLQELVGLEVVTDGEFRRLNFQDSFGEAVSGYDRGQATLDFYDQRTAGAQPLQRFELPSSDERRKGTPVVQRQRVVERLRLRRNLVLEEYSYAATVARKPVKVTLIGPDRISQRVDLANSAQVYPAMEDFLADVVEVERAMIKEFAAAGCRYVHIDAPGYTAYVDQPSLEAMRARGEDPMANFRRSLKADNDLIRGFGDVTFGIHLCRGNQRSMWHREGTYDAIAEMLFNELAHDRFLLEYDSPRAGGFAPLRFVPAGKTVVLGLVSTKVAQLETIDDLRRRIDEASRHVALEQLALSPQCGFASEFVGNLISEDDQKRKLELVVETARQVWG
jgi:5-methyltetrahydropteroyltriglutamate--homocysteine methyltransferase